MIPLFFIGNLQDEFELLTWLLYHLKENTIPNTNRELLSQMIQNNDYIGVLFCEFSIGGLLTNNTLAHLSDLQTSKGIWLP